MSTYYNSSKHLFPHFLLTLIRNKSSSYCKKHYQSTSSLLKSLLYCAFECKNFFVLNNSMVFILLLLALDYIGVSTIPIPL